MQFGGLNLDLESGQCQRWTHFLALFRCLPRATLLVSYHIRIPLDVSITGDRSSCFVADFFFFDCVSKNIFFYRFQFQVDLYISLFSNVYFLLGRCGF